MKLKDFDFRIWHKDSESFVDMKVSDTDLRIIPTDDNSMELELWTGYTDTKGTRIYENDFIRTDKGEIFLVVADGEITSWGLLKNGKKSFSLAEAIFEYEVEVIGNLHENPELKGRR